MIITPEQLEDLDGFQNDDQSNDWQNHDPVFEWTPEQLEEFERERRYAEQEAEAMAGWWDMEGVRCATFGRDPNENPYRIS